MPAAMVSNNGMKALRDPRHLLASGLADIRREFDVPDGFPPEVLQQAENAARRPSDSKADWLHVPFVTLDPAGATDLDQAFAIERSGPDFLLHYAIADVTWFVTEGSIMDAEAWRRGTTTYLPDGKASLYPPLLSEGAASLLPDGERPAIVLTVRIDQDGEVRLDGATRAIIRSRAKLAYETVQGSDLPSGFAELTARLADAEARRGAARVDPPEQQLEPDGQGGFTLGFRPVLASEVQNAALSLAANIAVAKAMLEANTGLFRVMDEPDDEAVMRLRASATGLGLAWSADVPLEDFERSLDATDPAQAAFMLAVRRASNGASYRPYTPDAPPWHAALAAPYAHATAPLRRLADRFVLTCVCAISNGQPPPANVEEAFKKLPRVMARASQRDGRIERAVIDLAETVMLSGCEGRQFTAAVTEMRNSQALIQLATMPVITSLDAPGAHPGETIRVRLTQADPQTRSLEFERVR